MNTRSVRIKDIAQLSGVSVGTVDRVLHNRGKVSEDALKKVLKVLDQIDYKPNVIARTLGSNRAYRIAVLMPNPEQDPYWASSKAGIEQAEAEWMRYGLKVTPYFFNLYDKGSFTKVAEAAATDNPDGILIAPIFYHETLPFFNRFRTEGIPCVLFNTQIEEAAPVSFIGQDLYQSGRVGGELMELALKGDAGSLAVLHLNEDLENSVHLAKKERGFREYFAKRNGSVVIKTLNLYNPTDSVLAEQLAGLLEDRSIKGIFVSTSKATYLIASFLERQKKTGIKLIGYDMLLENIRYMKQGLIHFLIHQNPKRQAFLGIQHLVNHLILKKSPPERDLLPLEIISPENVDSYLNSAVL